MTDNVPPANDVREVLARAKRAAVDYYRLTGKPLGITGEVGEYEAARLLGLTLADARVPGHDATDDSGIRYQIKSRAIPDPRRANSQRLGTIKPAQEWDAVLMVLMDQALQALEIWQAERDVVVAAMLGAEQYGFGTTAMIAVGCKMARQCHLNTCPVGVATQREDLRAKYFGTPEMVIRYLTHLAHHVRELLAELGYERVEDLIGRADLLQQLPPENGHRAAGIDLEKVIAAVDPEGIEPHRRVQERNDRGEALLDDRIIADVRTAIEGGAPLQRSYTIRNTDRTVGARLSGEIARRYGDRGLQDSSIDLSFRGSAGQSFGAFLTSGVRLHLVGEANDYVAKGMNGGEITIRPPRDAGFRGQDAVLVGNTVLYGATGGHLFVAGSAGERFGVRNSGARAVVEGVGDHGCEYMTDGVVVILGPAGRNFGAGMSDGVAFVLDEEGDFRTRVNQELVGLEQVTTPDSIELLEAMIRRHYELTDSRRAKRILDEWRLSLPKFWKVMPKFALTEEGPMTVVRRHLEGLRATTF